MRPPRTEPRTSPSLTTNLEFSLEATFRPSNNARGHPCLAMEQYKASIESVDTALNRLNQTLASYKLLSSEFGKSRPTRGEAQSEAVSPATTGAVAAPPPPDTSGNGSWPSPAASPTPPNLPIVKDPRASAPVHNQTPIERLVCSLRSSKVYPEVRTYYKTLTRSPHLVLKAHR